MTGHVDIPTMQCGLDDSPECTQLGFCRQTDRWQLRVRGHPDSFYIYSSHLRAGSTPCDRQDRLDGVTAIRANADALPVGSVIIFAGDYNFASASEDSYELLVGKIMPGPGQAFDPLGTGPWSCSGPNVCDPKPRCLSAIKHTQSTHRDQGGGFIGGGMDDRFDMQLGSAALFDGTGIDMMDVETNPDVYRAMGNDGMHFNCNINDPPFGYYPGDEARSMELAQNLFDTSDHLPVVV